MALPKLENEDIVEVTFKNLDKLHVSKTDCVYASRQYNNNCRVNGGWAEHFLLTGGKAEVTFVDKTTVEFLRQSIYASRIRVERFFLRSVKIIERYTKLKVGDIRLKIPTDPSNRLSIVGEGELTAAQVRSLLKQMKTLYFSGKRKAKNKPKPKRKPKTHKKGTKFTKKLFGNIPTDIMRTIPVDVIAIDWEESRDDVSSSELEFLYKGSYKNTNISWGLGMNFFWGSGRIQVRNPFTNSVVQISQDLVKSITVAANWTEPVKEESTYGDHDVFGKRLKTKKILPHRTLVFFESGITAGCKSFDMQSIKEIYKALCKTYGKPE